MCFFIHSMEINGHQFCFVNNSLQNIIFCVLQKKEKQHEVMTDFGGNYPFKKKDKISKMLLEVSLDHSPLNICLEKKLC